MNSLKPFVNYFSRTAWVLLFLGLALHFALPGMREPFDMMIAFCLIYFLGKVATVIHEAGHLMVAHWVGATPKRMTLGSGHEVHRTTWRNIKIVLKSNPVGGMAMAIFKDMPWLKLRFIAFSLGGVLFNVLSATVVYLLFGYRSSFMVGEQGIDVASAFIFVNALNLVNLVPFVSSFQGYAQPTDGLLVWQIIFRSHEKNFEGIEYAEDFFQAFEHIEDGNNDQAHKICLRLLEKRPNDINVLSILSTVQIRKLQLDEALQNLKKIEAEMNTKKLAKKRGMIFNNMAWIYLLKNDIVEAYHYSTQAIKLLPKNLYVEGTYGCVLVERGDVDIGVQWLLLHTSWKHVNNETLTASIYLALAYHLKKDFATRDKHAQRVNANLDKINKESLLLWDRCKSKMSDEP